MLSQPQYNRTGKHSIGYIHPQYFKVRIFLSPSLLAQIYGKYPYNSVKGVLKFITI